MQIQDIQKQKIALDKAYTKSSGELFSAYLKKLNGETKTGTQKALANEFYQEHKTLRNVYETQKYKLDIQETPSIHTMVAAVNYKQRLMIDDMNSKLEEAYKAMKDKFRSGNYSFAQKVELKEEYKELEKSLKENLTKEMAEFRSSYYDALTKRNNSKIDALENSLLSNLLSKI